MLSRSFFLVSLFIGGAHALIIWLVWQSAAVAPKTPSRPPLPVTIQIAPVVTATPEMPLPPPPATQPKLVPTATKTAANVEPVPQPASPPSVFSDAVATASESADSANTAEEPQPETSPPPALYAADYLSNPAPDYPKLSQKYREEGVVDVRVLVNPLGHAEQVELAQSSGFSRLDKAALTAVKNWRFIPQRQDSTLISSWIVVPVRFDLQKKESVRG